MTANESSTPRSGDGISALGREFASLFCIFRTSSAPSSAPSSAVAMVDVYGAASDVGLNCATGLNIGGGGGNSTRGADSSHSATTILMAGRDFKMFFLGGTTLHNKNEFRTNAAVRKFVSTPRNCQKFRASHKRTGAQPQFCSCSFWQTLEHQNALGQCKMFCGCSRFATFIKIQY